MATLGAILALRDKNCDLTLKYLMNLDDLSVNTIKHLANAYEKTLAR